MQISHTYFNRSIVTDFGSWWYGYNFRKLLKIFRYFLIKVWDTFSIGLLSKTIFEPWKKDVIDSKGASLNFQLNILIMNLMSRIIGFLVRGFVILIGFLAMFFMFLVSGIGFLIYVLAPLVILTMLIWGIVLVVSNE